MSVMMINVRKLTYVVQRQTYGKDVPNGSRHTTLHHSRNSNTNVVFVAGVMLETAHYSSTDVAIGRFASLSS